MEIIDIFDDYENLIGISEKDEAHKNKKWHKAVNLYIIDSKGNILLQKRSSFKKQYPNYWSCSVGGHVLSKEEPIDAIVRECYEELNLKIDKINLIHVASYKESNDSNFEFLNTYILKIELDINDISFNTNEISKLKWIHCNDLIKDLEKPKDNYLINKYEFSKVHEHMKNL